MNSKEIQIQIITQNMKNNILSKNILNKYLKKINNFDILVEFTQEDNRKYINFPLYLFSHNIKNSEFKLINEISLLERPSEMNIGISIYSNGLNDIKIIDSGKIPIAASESGIKQIGFKFGYYTKGCVWTKIKIKSNKSDKIILFCSIHLPTDKYDGITNLKYILEKIEEIKKISNECDEVFLGGDFNFKIEKNGKDVFNKILKDGILKDYLYNEPINTRKICKFTYKFKEWNNENLYVNVNKYSFYKLHVWNKNYYGFPFQKITDENNIENNNKIIALSAPLYKKEREIFYKLEKKGYKFIGISSYGYFPIYSKDDSQYDSRASELKNPDMQNILTKMIGWLYCNEDPSFIQNLPKLLFSESDSPLINNVKIKNLKKEYDIIYNAGSDSGFHKYHKNWILAKKCFKKMIEKGLKILIIGREKMDDPSEEHPNIILKPFTPYYDFVDLIEKSKICFIPNISDASPRVITESFIKGVPVIVNRKIFGGWKYICRETGKFFDNEDNIMDKIIKIIKNLNEGKYNTREWFIKNYYINNGTKLIPKSGINLRNFIDTIYGRKDLKTYIKSRMTGVGIAVDENKILSKCDRILYIKNDQNEEKIKINSYETKVLMLNSDHNGVSLNINI